MQPRLSHKSWRNDLPQCSLQYISLWSSCRITINSILSIDKKVCYSTNPRHPWQSVWNETEQDNRTISVGIECCPAPNNKQVLFRGIKHDLDYGMTICPLENHQIGLPKLEFRKQSKSANSLSFIFCQKLLLSTLNLSCESFHCWNIKRVPCIYIFATYKSADYKL